MRLLKLTDGNGTGFEEYVDVDEIARIETKTVTRFEKVENEIEAIGFLGIKYKKKVPQEVLKENVPVGSIVFTKIKGDATFVKESPAQIIEMIKNKQFVEV